MHWNTLEQEQMIDDAPCLKETNVPEFQEPIVSTNAKYGPFAVGIVREATRTTSLSLIGLYRIMQKHQQQQVPALAVMATRPRPETVVTVGAVSMRRKPSWTTVRVYSKRTAPITNGTSSNVCRPWN